MCLEKKRLSSDAINSQYDERLDNEGGGGGEGLGPASLRPGSISPSTAFHKTIAAARQR